MPKGFVSAIENNIDNIPSKFFSTKVKFAENLAIIKKRKLYKEIEWDKQQEDKFNDYWTQNYGKKIKPYWHKLYQSFNDVFDEKYIPEKLYSLELEPLLNPSRYSTMFDDKSIIETYFSDSKTIKLPETFLVSISGQLCNKNRERVSQEKAIKLLSDVGECIIKPTVNTSSGNGVSLCNFIGGVDKLSGSSIFDILLSSGKDFIIQKKVVNNENISKIHPESLNTIRVITYIMNDEVFCCPLTLRVGIGNSSVDNIHAGGLCIGINEDGTLKEKAYQLGWGDKNITFQNHPTSGILFKDYYIGDIKKVVETARHLHEKLPYLGIISWDFTIDDCEDAVLIEINSRGQSVWFPQIINGESLFGDNTGYMLSLLHR